MLSFICWVIVVALFCVAAWRIARRRYTGGCQPYMDVSEFVSVYGQ